MSSGIVCWRIAAHEDVRRVPGICGVSRLARNRDLPYSINYADLLCLLDDVFHELWKGKGCFVCFRVVIACLVFESIPA